MVFLTGKSLYSKVNWNSHCTHFLYCPTSWLDFTVLYRPLRCVTLSLLCRYEPKWREPTIFTKCQFYQTFKYGVHHWNYKEVLKSHKYIYNYVLYPALSLSLVIPVPPETIHNVNDTLCDIYKMCLISNNFRSSTKFPHICSVRFQRKILFRWAVCCNWWAHRSLKGWNSGKVQ